MTPPWIVEIGSHRFEVLETATGLDVRVDGAHFISGVNKREAGECLQKLVEAYSVKPQRYACPVCGRLAGVNQAGALQRHLVPEGGRTCSAVRKGRTLKIAAKAARHG